MIFGKDSLVVRLGARGRNKQPERQRARDAINQVASEVCDPFSQSVLFMLSCRPAWPQFYEIRT